MAITPFKVIESHRFYRAAFFTNRKPVCDFVLVLIVT